MNVNLTPDLPQVDPCKILNLVVKRSNGTYIHKQYLTVVPFDYGDLLEEVRQQDLIKSEDILHALGAMLIERKYVIPADTYMLDIGTAGRVSGAIQDLYKYRLNANHSTVKRAAAELTRHHFEFEGPEGTLHVLHTDTREVAAHVHIGIGDSSGLYQTLTLDVLGPYDVDFPYDFKEQLTRRFTECLFDNHPEIEWQLSVNLTRSDYALAMESRHARSEHRGVRYSPCDWIQGL
jgi:hypothetical protein